ncbi:MAG: hypothetical protein J7647_19715 [Cyanobacteria bacterium SBLK]|nr:hypothetical protein [Cyanobacteria bacterium SBLK]
MLPQYQIDAARALAGQVQQDYLGGATPGTLPPPPTTLACTASPLTNCTFNPLCPTFVCPPGAVQGGAPGTGAVYTTYTAMIPACPPSSPPYCPTVSPVCPPPAQGGAPGTIFTEWCTLPPGAAAPAAGGIAVPTIHTAIIPVCPPTITFPITIHTVLTPVCPPIPGPVPTIVTAQIPACPTPAAPGTIGPVPVPTVRCVPATLDASCSTLATICTLPTVCPPGAAAPAAGGIAPTIQTAQIPACPPNTANCFPPTFDCFPPTFNNCQVPTIVTAQITVCPTPAVQGGAPGTVAPTLALTCPPTINCPPTKSPVCVTFTPPVCPVGPVQGGAPGTVAPTLAPTCPPTINCPPTKSPVCVTFTPPFCPVGPVQGGAPGTVYTAPTICGRTEPPVCYPTYFPPC